jgi:hypothetical protein
MERRRHGPLSGRPHGSDGLHMERCRRGPPSAGELEWASDPKTVMAWHGATSAWTSGRLSVQTSQRATLGGPKNLAAGDGGSLQLIYSDMHREERQHIFAHPLLSNANCVSPLARLLDRENTRHRSIFAVALSCWAQSNSEVRPISPGLSLDWRLNPNLFHLNLNIVAVRQGSNRLGSCC